MKPISELTPSSRTWIYISPKKLTGDEKAHIMQEAELFIAEWAAHGNKLEAGFEILHDVFLCIVADENQMQASGCSIDKSVHFIQGLGKTLNIDFLNRTYTWYRDEQGEMVCVSLHEFWARRKAGIVEETTPVFNTLVRTVGELGIISRFHFQIAGTNPCTRESMGRLNAGFSSTYTTFGTLNSIPKKI